MLIVGNSVSLPHLGEGRAYPELLEERLANQGTVERIIEHGKTIDELESRVLAGIDAHPPDTVVIQIGINECTPRPLSRAERSRLGRVRPWFRDRIIQLIHIWRPQIIRLRPLIQNTSIPLFRTCIARILESIASRGARVLILPITTVPASVEARTPYMNREIAKYNAVLRSLARPGVQFVEESEIFGSARPDELCAGPDTVHLNPAAHEAIARWLARWLATSC